MIQSRSVLTICYHKVLIDIELMTKFPFILVRIIARKHSLISYALPRCSLYCQKTLRSLKVHFRKGFKFDLTPSFPGPLTAFNPDRITDPST